MCSWARADDVTSLRTVELGMSHAPSAALRTYTRVSTASTIAAPVMSDAATAGGRVHKKPTAKPLLVIKNMQMYGVIWYLCYRTPRRNYISGAEDAYRKVIAIDIMDANAWYNLGILLECSILGDTLCVKDVFRNCLEINLNHELAELIRNFLKNYWAFAAVPLHKSTVLYVDNV